MDGIWLKAFTSEDILLAVAITVIATAADRVESIGARLTVFGPMLVGFLMGTLIGFYAEQTMTPPGIIMKAIMLSALCTMGGQLLSSVLPNFGGGSGVLTAANAVNTTRAEVKEEVKEEVREAVKAEVKEEVKAEGVANK